MATAPVTVTVLASGAAYVALGAGPAPEVKYSVALDALQDADTIPALEAIVLDFDHYRRLVGIRVESSVDSVLPPSLLEPVAPASPEDGAGS
jgi:hypothetical protein